MTDEKDENPLSVAKKGIDKLFDTVNHFITSKYSHDKTGIYVHWGIVATILIGIIILSCKLESSIIGTLLGTLIGFSFGNFPKANRGNDSK